MPEKIGSISPYGIHLKIKMIKWRSNFFEYKGIIKFGDTLIDIHSDDYLNKGCGVTLWPCHFTIKKYLKAKEEEDEELWKLKYNFTMQKTYNPQKNPLKRKPKSFKIVLL